MLASDSHNPEYVNPTNPDNALAVEFYDFIELNKWATQESGIKTYLPECSFVRIAIPGNDKTVVERKASENDKRRFPRQWMYYQMQTGKIAQSSDVPGVKLKDWPELGEEQVRNLEHLRFFTVEQIAGASDAQIQGVGTGGQGLKNRAIQFLQARNAAVSSEEIAKRDEEISRQREELNRLSAIVESLVHPKKKVA